MTNLRAKQVLKCFEASWAPDRRGNHVGIWDTTFRGRLLEDPELTLNNETWICWVKEDRQSRLKLIEDVQCPDHGQEKKSAAESFVEFKVRINIISKSQSQVSLNHKDRYSSIPSSLAYLTHGLISTIKHTSTSWRQHHWLGETLQRSNGQGCRQRRKDYCPESQWDSYLLDIDAQANMIPARAILAQKGQPQNAESTG